LDQQSRPVIGVAIVDAEATMTKRLYFPSTESCARWILLGASTASLLSITVPAGAQTNADHTGTKKEAIMTMKQDLAMRSREIHWPEGFNPATADLFSHNELLIHASCEKIWGHIVDARKWPQWYPNSNGVELPEGAKVLGDGTTWRWSTFGLSIESRVQEYVPHTRLGWYGYAPGTKPSFYHTWYLAPQGTSCLVITDEVGVGKDAAHLRETDESLLHRGHDLWLATLKWVSEGN
jgi:hypothetical protein